MVKYSYLINIKIRDKNEPFVEIDKNLIPNGYLKKMSEMKNLLNNRVFVRRTVYKKLIKIQKNLKKIDSRLSLYICYGYRSLKVQTNLFQEQLIKVSKLKFYNNPIDLYEKTHELIAVPSVAGHPTGGAIDLFIINNKTKKIINFGSEIYEFSNKCKTFYQNISKKAKENRLLLRKLMLSNNFASYDGEWWHFSYGDREWAYYYKKRQAIYKQISLKEIIFQ